jgi:hypothetical protein
MARKFKPKVDPHAALMSAFESADANTPRTKEGNGSYGFAASGMPRSPAQMAAVKKAAAVSAKNRHARADARHSTAPDLGQTKTTSTGSLGLNKPKKGLLSF